MQTPPRFPRVALGFGSGARVALDWGHGVMGALASGVTLCHGSEQPPCPLSPLLPLPEKAIWVYQAVLSLLCLVVISIYSISLWFQGCRR